MAQAMISAIWLAIALVSSTSRRYERTSRGGVRPSRPRVPGAAPAVVHEEDMDASGREEPHLVERRVAHGLVIGNCSKRSGWCREGSDAWEDLSWDRASAAGKLFPPRVGGMAKPASIALRCRASVNGKASCLGALVPQCTTPTRAPLERARSRAALGSPQLDELRADHPTRSSIEPLSSVAATRSTFLTSLGSQPSGGWTRTGSAWWSRSAGSARVVAGPCERWQ